jgi:hypothetical protein
MALTVSRLARGGFTDGLSAVVHEITFDDSYPTGGEALTANTIGGGSVVAAFFEVEDGYVFRYDKANSKVLAYWVDTTVDGAALAEVADTTDLSAVVVRAIFLIRG